MSVVMQTPSATPAAFGRLPLEARGEGRKAADFRSRVETRHIMESSHSQRLPRCVHQMNHFLDLQFREKSGGSSDVASINFQ